MNRSRVVSVALPLPIRRSFSYLVPPAIEFPEPGTRVRVPFGERVLTGVVLGAGEPVAGAREILEVLDAEPVCPPELLAAAQRVARRFFASTGEVLKSALPARLPAAGAARYRITRRGSVGTAGGPEGEILRRLQAGESVRAAELLPGSTGAIRSLEDRGWIRVVSSGHRRRSRDEKFYVPAVDDPAERDRRLGRLRRGRDVLRYLDEVGQAASASEIRHATRVPAAALENLVARGLLRPCAPGPRPAVTAPGRGPAWVLTREQEHVLGEIRSAIARREFFPAVLQGVTGSGKTEVYLRAIAECLQSGRGAVWLVPEIALTPVFARALALEFGDRAAVLHSALSERERAQAWDRTRAGEVRVVIGPRSAAFAPVADPGLFLVDEEHDASYKQRESPRYDAREVVSIRAKTAAAPLVFGSATPSMEAWHAARDGRMHLLRLTQRIDGRPMPEVSVVDLRREPSRPEEKGIPLFSRPLRSRLAEVFARGEQAILLQPRRGFAPFLLCRDCGHDFRCAQCSVARTVHDRGRTLICHYCGQRGPAPLRCPDCGGALLEAIGAGTQRVADRFAAEFPGVSFAVLDRDTARKGGAERVVDDVLSGRVACLIGTQMVAKGHDFPNVTAVGVLSADTLLNFPDFRAAEKTFQLVAQVAGRAGRGGVPGTVHVQTFHPQHPAIRHASAHDVDGFAAEELEFRRSFFYPPFSELAALLISSSDRGKAEAAAAEIGAAARDAGPGLRLSGPAPAPLERLLGRWRFQVLVRSADRRSLLAALELCVPERPPSGVQIAVDVDPQDLM